jgi:hypothetical protein
MATEGNQDSNLDDGIAEGALVELLATIYLLALALRPLSPRCRCRPSLRLPIAALRIERGGAESREGARGALEVAMERERLPESEEEGRPWRLAALRWRRRRLGGSGTKRQAAPSDLVAVAALCGALRQPRTGPHRPFFSLTNRGLPHR